jgi:uncharacterized protein involved in exopolysaccharide biosynthesis
MNKGASFKALISVVFLIAVAFIGFSGNQLVAQNAELSKQVSGLSAQVKELQTQSQKLQDQIGRLEQQLEPRFKQLLGHNP